MMRIKYEGGPAHGTAGGYHPDTQTVFYGRNGHEVRYIRTARTDDKGRTVFTAAGVFRRDRSTQRRETRVRRGELQRRGCNGPRGGGAPLVGVLSVGATERVVLRGAADWPECPDTTPKRYCRGACGRHPPPPDLPRGP